RRVLIDIEIELRRIFHAVRAHLAEIRVLTGESEQLIAHIDELFALHAADIDELHVEAAGNAEFSHGRRQHREDHAVTDLAESAERPLHDLSRALTRLRALRPRMQLAEQNGLVLTHTGKAET